MILVEQVEIDLGDFVIGESPSIGATGVEDVGRRQGSEARIKRLLRDEARQIGKGIQLTDILEEGEVDGRRARRHVFGKKRPERRVVVGPERIDPRRGGDHIGSLQGSRRSFREQRDDSGRRLPPVLQSLQGLQIVRIDRPIRNCNRHFEYPLLSIKVLYRRAKMLPVKASSLHSKNAEKGASTLLARKSWRFFFECRPSSANEAGGRLPPSNTLERIHEENYRFGTVSAQGVPAGRNLSRIGCRKASARRSGLRPRRAQDD